MPPDKLITEVQRILAEVTAHQLDPHTPRGVAAQAVSAAAHLKAAEHHLQEMLTEQLTWDSRPGGQ